MKSKIRNLILHEINISEKINKLEEKINHLEELSYADANDYKAFYNLLLSREPEDGVIKENTVQRKDLFNNIIFSEEFKTKNTHNSGVENGHFRSYSQVGEDKIVAF